MGMFGMGGKKSAAPAKSEAPAKAAGGQKITAGGGTPGQAQGGNSGSVKASKKVIAPGGSRGAAQPGKSATARVIAPKAQVQVSKPAAGQPGNSVTRPITSVAANPDEPGSLAKARGGAPCRSGDKALTDFLAKTRLITEDQTTQALAIAQQDNLPLDVAVVKLNLMTEEVLVNALTQECYVPHLKVDKYEIRKKALDTISKDDAAYYGVFPVDKLGSLLTLAMVNPLDQETIKTIESKTGLDVKRVVATRSEILQGIDKYYGGKVQAKDHSLAFTNEGAPDGKSSTQIVTKGGPGGSTTTLGSGRKPARTADGLEIEDIDDLLLGDEIVAPTMVQPLKLEEPPLVVPASDILEINEIPAPQALEQRSPATESARLAVPEFEDDALDLTPAPAIKPGTARISAPDPALVPAPGKTPAQPAAAKAAKAERPLTTSVVQLIPVLDDEFQHAISHGKAHVFEKWTGLQTRNRIINAITVDGELDEVLGALYRTAG